MCGRVGTEVPGFVFMGRAKADTQFALYRREGDPALGSALNGQHNKSRNGHPAAPLNKPIDWEVRTVDFCSHLTPDLRRELAEILELPEDCLESLRVGHNGADHHGPCWTFPEVDNTGIAVGITRRYRRGEKKTEQGGSRGLFVPHGWNQRDGPIFCPEGPTCTLALTAMSLAAVGRPSNMAGVEYLAELFRDLPPDRTIVVMGEWDANEKGTWPGRDGAVKVACELAQRIGRRIIWALPPKGSKDVRAWVLAQGPDPNCADTWGDLGAKFLAAVECNFQDAKIPESETFLNLQPLNSAAFTNEPLWPDRPFGAEVGLVGEIVAKIEPETEADPTAILAQFLVAFGSSIGRSAYYSVGARRHYANLFLILVGRTAKGRKGTALSWIETLFAGADPTWHDQCLQSGLSSGEGLIASVRDPDHKKEDAGACDKRLMVVEEEFSSVLRMARRDGNILSAVIRQAWDTGKLRTMTRHNPLRATDAHISILGHITQDELVSELSRGDAANGFANRFIWVSARRSKLLPDGGQHLDLSNLQERIKKAIVFGRGVGRMSRSRECADFWRECYSDLSHDRPGLLGLVTNRAEAQVLRLSSIYALLDLTSTIEKRHLEAALSFWRYSEKSCRRIFGESTGNPDADCLLDALRSADGMTLTQISQFYGRNKPASEIKKTLAFLVENRLAIPGKPAAGGKPAEKWRALTDGTNPTKATKLIEPKGFA